LFGGAEGPVHSHTHEKYVALDSETGSAYGQPPVSAHPHPHPHPHPQRPAEAEPQQ
jgi:urease accessory protein